MAAMHTTARHRIRVDLAYDGTQYHGWATQPGLPTIQETVETGLTTIFRQPVVTTVAGRTDAGVHATGQVMHFDIAIPLWDKLAGTRPYRSPDLALVSKLNGVLAREDGAIRILSARIAPTGFDARFSPLSRSYQYRIATEPDPLTRHFTYYHRKLLNVDLMAAEIAGLEGLHDFGSFCKPRPGATTIRTLQHFSITTETPVLTVRLSADAFCHHMVRALVGALLCVGDGSRQPGWLRQRLAHPVRDSHMMLAPAHGLLLEKVHYPGDNQVGFRAAQTRAKRSSVPSSSD